MNTFDLKYLTLTQEPCELWPEDYQLFEQMEKHYISDEERLFFAKMRLKMEYECAPSGDTLMKGINNPDGIYFLRLDHDEFVVGRYTGEVEHVVRPEIGMDTMSHKYIEYHAMSLSEILSYNLKDIIGRDITLLQWLRELNYQNVNYNGNVAYN
jgi:hypothetical protein